MADDFFKQEVNDALAGEQPQEQNDNIKIGDREFTQEELNRRIGLSDIAIEAEDKYKTKIDRVWPEFTKKSQAISDYEKRIQELETKTQQPAQQQSYQLTPEQRSEAVKQLDDLLKDSRVLDERTRTINREELAAKDLITDINVLLDEAKQDGKPTADVAQILEHMSQTGIKNPRSAYRDMFFDELAQVEADKLSTLRRPGLVTTTQSTAGGKVPMTPKAPRTREELMAAVNEELSRGSM